MQLSSFLFQWGNVASYFGQTYPKVNERSFQVMEQKYAISARMLSQVFKTLIYTRILRTYSYIMLQI